MEINIPDFKKLLHPVVKFFKNLIVFPKEGDVWVGKLGSPNSYGSSSITWNENVRPLLVVKIDRKTVVIADPSDPKRLIYKERKYVKLLTKVG